MYYYVSGCVCMYNTTPSDPAKTPIKKQRKITKWSRYKTRSDGLRRERTSQASKDKYKKKKKKKKKRKKGKVSDRHGFRETVIKYP